MRPLGASARTVLALFDEQLGGLAAPASVVVTILAQRGVDVSEKTVLMTLNRLWKKGELSKVPRPKGGAVYTRSCNIDRDPGMTRRLERLPALNIRSRAETSEKRYDLRVKRRIKALGDEAVRAGSHDFRYNFKTNQWYPCHTCGRDANGRFGPCKLRIAPEEVAKRGPPDAGARTSGSGSASRAKKRSRARKRGT